MKDVRFAAIVPYNFSSLEAPTSRQEKKANWQRSSSIFMSQKGSHFIPYQRKCQIHIKGGKIQETLILNILQGKNCILEMKNTRLISNRQTEIEVVK